MTAVHDATLARTYRDWSARSVLFGSVSHGLGPEPFMVAGSALGPILADLSRLADIRSRTVEVYIMGGWDAASTPPHEWFKAPAADGWSVTYRPGNKSSLRAGEYTRGERRVMVRMSAAWFDTVSDAGYADRAYRRLGALLRSHFDPHAHPMGTPSRTGQDLLERSLPKSREYLATPPEVQQLIRRIGQGRMEFVAPAELEGVRALAVFDGRWMYASCLRNLPVSMVHGPLMHDSRSEFVGRKVPGFYRVIWRVPDDWRHIGLLPYRDEQQLDSEGNAMWTWPRHAGAAYESWVTEPELRLALEQGWRVHILERILYAHENTPGADPARHWIDNLRSMRAQAAQDAPVAAAIRHLCLDTVGAWWRSTRRAVHIAQAGDEASVPEGASVRPVYEFDRHGRPTRLLYTEYLTETALDPTHEPTMRPEWSAMVWGRAREALARFALRFPPELLVALRSDAVAVRLDHNGELGMPPEDMAAEYERLFDLPSDTGQPGAFRLKSVRDLGGVWPVPRDETAWRALGGEPAPEGDEGGRE